MLLEMLRYVLFSLKMRKKMSQSLIYHMSSLWSELSSVLIHGVLVSRGDLASLSLNWWF